MIPSDGSSYRVGSVLAKFLQNCARTANSITTRVLCDPCEIDGNRDDEKDGEPGNLTCLT